MTLLPGHFCTDDSGCETLCLGGLHSPGQWLHIEEHNCELLIFCIGNPRDLGELFIPSSLYSCIDPGPHGEYVSTIYICYFMLKVTPIQVSCWKYVGVSSGLQIKYVMLTPPSCFLRQVYPVFLPLLGKICEEVFLNCFPEGSCVSGFSATDILE